MFLLSQLMPTLVEDKKKDYCHKCFKDFTRSNISKSAFKIGVASQRTAEKYAVTLRWRMTWSTRF